MRFPPAPPPFTDRITCVGKLSAGGRSTGPLDILIDVPNTAAQRMRGWVLGNKATMDDIKRAQGAHGGAMRLSADSGSDTITSEGIWVRSTRYFGADRQRMPDGLHGIACEFDCLNLTRRVDHGGGAEVAREVRFLVRGPGVRGLVTWSHCYSFTGSNTVKVRGRPLATGGRLPLAMSVLPHFFHDNVGGRSGEDEGEDGTAEANVTSETYVMAFACRPRKTRPEYGDEVFLADARQAVEDMCLLLSLLAGRMITWHSYYQSGPGLLLRYNRSLGPVAGAARSEEIVQSRHLRAFLRRAFRRLRRMRADGIDLEIPIISAITGAQARVAQQRFGEFFLALEALHSIDLARRAKTFLLDDKVFKRARKRLKEPLAAALHAEGVRSRKITERMTQKLTELNRPALWDGVRSLLARLRVDWEDLYPEPGAERPTFLKLRNTLFHSHTRAEGETIHKEAVRVEAVVHRILLRWLGWEDLWNVPPPEVRHYLTGKALPERHRLSGRLRRVR